MSSNYSDNCLDRYNLSEYFEVTFSKFSNLKQITCSQNNCSTHETITVYIISNKFAIFKSIKNY